MNTVSVIVLCRNEVDHISSCLSSLLSNDYDLSLVDLVVVDGMSTDGTREAVQEYVDAHPNVRMVDNRAEITPAAWNIGIRSTQSEYVMPVSGHAVYPTNYMSRLIAGCKEYSADCFAGVLNPVEGKTVRERCATTVYQHSFAVGKSFRARAANALFVPFRCRTAYCGCFRRDVYDRIGLYNEKLVRAQDREFNFRLSERGGIIYADPKTVIEYSPRVSFFTFGSWTFRGAFWLFYARRFTSTRLLTPSNLVPAVFVLWHLLPMIAVLFSPLLGAALVLPIIAYWGTNTVCSTVSAWKLKSIGAMPILMIYFALTHYLYGLGSIVGWLRAALQGKDVQDDT